jgi:RimJ/RimL family protein N-acetyltransferase
MPPDTGRLTFREMASGDLGDLAALLGDPEVMTYYPRPKTRQEAAQWIDWNRRLYRTRGDYARASPGASRLIAIIHPDNRPSQRVAEKIGLRPEKRSLVHGGREAVIYAGSV